MIKEGAGREVHQLYKILSRLSLQSPYILDQHHFETIKKGILLNTVNLTPSYQNIKQTTTKWKYVVAKAKIIR